MNANSTTTGIQIDGEIQRVLHENRVDLVEHLLSGGFDVKTAPMSYADESQPGAKGTAMVLLASSAAALLVAEAIVRVVRSLTAARPVIVEEQTLVPTLDANGRAVTDSQGRPILYWAQRHRMLESSSVSQASEGTQFTIQPTRLSLSFGSTRTHGR
jgi:hypothetical protein